MSDRLTRLGLHFDELNKISIVDPEVAAKSSELKEECSAFIEDMTRFQDIVDGFISVVDSLGQEVEREKMKAVGTRNLIKSMAKQREAREQQYHALIIEKSTELERLRIQHQALLRTEAEQQDVIDQMVLHFVENYEITSDEHTTKTPRWLGDILEDTDISLSSLLSQPVDGDRVQFALQFVLGYQGLMERLRDSARTRDPRTLQVFRQLKTRAFRPAFMDQLPNLSMRQKELGWSNEDLDTLRTAVLKINKLIEEFKSAIAELL